MNTIKKIICAVLFPVLILADSAMADSTLFTVNGMVCAFCAQGIEKKLKSLPETEDVYINLEKKLVAVEAKEGKAIANDKIIHEIKEAGYDVSQVEVSEKSVADVKKHMEEKHEK